MRSAPTSHGSWSNLTCVKMALLCFGWNEFQQLLQENGVRIFTFAQCRFGSDAEKLTDLMSNQDLDHMVLTCNHEPQIWIVPWNGRRYFLPHAPLRGRQRAIKARDWNSSMLRQYEPTGPYVTKAHAAYPAQLNRKPCTVIGRVLLATPEPPTSRVAR